MNLKDQYDVKCAKCGHEFTFKPSISMELGINTGHATCKQCNTYLHLSIDHQIEKGISMIWEDYLATRGWSENK